MQTLEGCILKFKGPICAAKSMRFMGASIADLVDVERPIPQGAP